MLDARQHTSNNIATPNKNNPDTVHIYQSSNHPNRKQDYSDTNSMEEFQLSDIICLSYPTSPDDNNTHQQLTIIIKLDKFNQSCNETKEMTWFCAKDNVLEIINTTNSLIN